MFLWSYGNNWLCSWCYFLLSDPFKVFGNSALSNVIGNMPVISDHFKNGFTRQHPILSPPKFCPSGLSENNYSSLSRSSQYQKSLLPYGLWSGSLKQQRTNFHTSNIWRFWFLILFVFFNWCYPVATIYLTPSMVWPIVCQLVNYMSNWQLYLNSHLAFAR